MRSQIYVVFSRCRSRSPVHERLENTVARVVRVDRFLSRSPGLSFYEFEKGINQVATKPFDLACNETKKKVSAKFREKEFPTPRRASRSTQRGDEDDRGSRIVRTSYL